jgi:hypothetical protein
MQVLQSIDLYAPFTGHLAQCPEPPEILTFPSLPVMSVEEKSAAHYACVSPIGSSEVLSFKYGFPWTFIFFPYSISCWSKHSTGIFLGKEAHDAVIRAVIDKFMSNVDIYKVNVFNFVQRL